MSFASRFKLSAMMFLQFMLVAAFWVQLSSYLDNMKVSGLMFSLIMSTMAIGSIFSPLVGMFADRVANRSWRFSTFLWRYCSWRLSLRATPY